MHGKLLKCTARERGKITPAWRTGNIVLRMHSTADYSTTTIQTRTWRLATKSMKSMYPLTDSRDLLPSLDWVGSVHERNHFKPWIEKLLAFTTFCSASVCRTVTIGNKWFAIAYSALFTSLFLWFAKQNRTKSFEIPLAPVSTGYSFIRYPSSSGGSSWCWRLGMSFKPTISIFPSKGWYRYLYEC